MQAQLKNTNTLWGVLLVALGAFFLLQVTGIFGILTSLFWSVAFAAAGAVFLYVFLTALHTRWWAAIPGFTLLGLAAMIFYDRFAPPFFSDIGAAVFLASIGAGFVAIFFTNREQWWAVIPGGTLLSVAGVVLVTQADIGFLNPASVLFIGLGLTFGLLGLMSTYLNTNLRWAYIPAAILLVMGTVIFTPFAGALGWIWPLAFVGGGAYLILRRPQSMGRTSNLPVRSAAATEDAPPAASTPMVQATPVFVTPTLAEEPSEPALAR